MAESGALLSGTEVDEFDFLCLQQCGKAEQCQDNAPDERHFGALGDVHSTAARVSCAPLLVAKLA